jgi:hypothetical protein
VAESSRTERDVLQALTVEERTLLRRVLEIERELLHVSAADPTEDLITAVKEIIP